MLIWTGSTFFRMVIERALVLVDRLQFPEVPDRIFDLILKDMQVNGFANFFAARSSFEFLASPKGVTSGS